MKLSEAMRKGSKLHPQSFGMTGKPRRKWFGLFGPMVQATCAMRAACDGANIPVYLSRGESTNDITIRPGCDGPRVTAEVPDSWYEVLKHETVCLYCSKSDFVVTLIAHLNDNHYLSREKIADWVEEIETYLATNQEAGNAERVSE